MEFVFEVPVSYDFSLQSQLLETVYWALRRKENQGDGVLERESLYKKFEFGEKLNLFNDSSNNVLSSSLLCCFSSLPSLCRLSVQFFFSLLIVSSTYENMAVLTHPES